jgi:hypothetical protein
VLGVALAVELVHVDRVLAELAREVARLDTGVGLRRCLGDRRDVALVADDPVLRRDGQDLEVVPVTRTAVGRRGPRSSHAVAGAEKRRSNRTFSPARPRALNNLEPRPIVMA